MIVMAGLAITSSGRPVVAKSTKNFNEPLGDQAAERPAVRFFIQRSAQIIPNGRPSEKV
jgi:hypothetical protein